jgi:hypothetical protein
MDETRLYPWEQRDDETERQFYAFTCFRDIPPFKRTIMAAYRTYTGEPDASQAPGWFCQLAKQFNWHERVREFDRYLDRKMTEKRVDAYLEKAEEQGKDMAVVDFYYLDAMNNAHNTLVEWSEKDEVRHGALPRDYNSLLGRIIEGASLAHKIRSARDPDDFGDPTAGMSDAELEETVRLIRELEDGEQREQEGDAGAALPPDDHTEDD